MKKGFSIVIGALVIASVLLTGCTNNESTSKASSSSKTSASSSSSKTKSSKSDGDSTKILKDYENSFYTGNDVYGVWTLDVDSSTAYSFIFRNDSYAELVMGGEGDFVALEVDKSKKTLKASFVAVIDGTYKYTLSDENQKLTLKNTSDNSEIKLKRNTSFEFVPDPPKNPTIDKHLLGWWKTKTGQIYYFGKDGLMYSNQISIETYYTYNAKDGNIEATYEYGEPTTINISYNYSKGKLSIEGTECEKYNP